MSMAKHPIESVQWVDPDDLIANNWNPNHVQTAEMKLLEFSILQNGWIQPVLVTQDMVVIDGFHRATLAKTSQAIQDKWGKRVPVVVMDMTEPERMMLTIRINRAKGSHAAFKMSDIVRTLMNDYGITAEELKQGIGADDREIEILLSDTVFKKLGTAEHKYSRAWYPTVSE